MAAASEINVASEKSRPREGQGCKRPSGRGRLPAGCAKPATGDDALRGQLVQATPEQRSAWPEGSADFQRTSLCSNLPGPWKYRDPSDGSVVCSEKLIEQNLNLARKYAWNWSKKSAFDYQELEALGYLGLIKGCRKFDPRSGYKLSTICVPYINGEILHFFRDKGYAIKYPSKWREIMPKARKRLEAGEDPAVIAEDLGMSLSDLEEMLGSMCGTSELRDEVVGESSDEVELNLLKPLVVLSHRSWTWMAAVDQQQVVKWWEENKRRAAVPRQQIASFRQVVRHMLEGRKLPEIRDQLCIDYGILFKPQAKKSRTRNRSKLRGKRELDSAIHQMGLVLYETPESSIQSSPLPPTPESSLPQKGKNAEGNGGTKPRSSRSTQKTTEATTGKSSTGSKHHPTTLLPTHALSA